MRDKTTIAALEWVSLDGRTQDYWVVFGGGRAAWPTMLILVDCSSNMVLGHLLVETENATETVRLIKQACEAHGILDGLYTDNGSAFTGKKVAGGNPHHFCRTSKDASKAVMPGVCKIMGITMKFAEPGNGRAKIAERIFSDLSRVIDDRPEFKNTHAGHAPGASPSSDIVPIAIEDARRIMSREIARYNNETGRRGQGANGRSYAQIFNDGLANRVTRRPTKRQLYLAGLIYDIRAVNRWGCITIDKWTYGNSDTQDALLPYHGKNQRILFGREPDDFAAPAMAFSVDGTLICDSIPAIKATPYDSADGIRRAKKNKKDARAKLKAASAANNYLDDAEVEEALAALGEQKPEAKSKDEKVVEGQFKSPIGTKKKATKKRGQSVSPEMYSNFYKALAAHKSSRKSV